LKARRLIEGSAYGPETLDIISKALDGAWAEIGHRFSEEAHEDARLRLAHALLVVVEKDGKDDPEQLKNNALKVMALRYRDL
jgi:hypothetical protein